MLWDAQGVNRQAVGFVMTFFRLRLGSSLHAFQKSVVRLEQRLRTGDSTGITWNDLPDLSVESFSDLDPETDVPDPEITSAALPKLRAMLDHVSQVSGVDSKFNCLLEEIDQLRTDGYGKVMVFSQFWDTQEWLREQLAGDCDAAFLGGLSGPVNWRLVSGGEFQSVDRGKVVQAFRECEEGILLCTESASESLNFQFCSAIINYDIPWNPMRLEQRIGRIDRIGQIKSEIRIPTSSTETV